jgi:hypothetical protein
MTNHLPDLAPLLEGFFTKRLIAQRNVSKHTTSLPIATRFACCFSLPKRA